MAPVVFFVLLALPFVEVWVAIEVARQIGVGLTILALALLSFSGVYLLRRQGMTVWRRARTEMSQGKVPTAPLLDGAMVIVGGICLTVPGFITGAFGALLMLPPVRALLRPLMLAWATRRASRAMRSGRFSGVVVDSVIGPDGQRRTRTRTMGDVIDSEGWDVEADPPSLDPGDGQGPPPRP